MSVGTHPNFPNFISMAEAHAGFVTVHIVNPHAAEPGNSEELHAVVCPVDRTNRVLKARTGDGVIEYVHRRRDPETPLAPAGGRVWRNVGHSYPDMGNAIAAAGRGDDPPPSPGPPVA